MKISHIEPVRLVEGLDRNHSRSYRLWESAGHTLLKEYQIDPKLIPQLFQEIEAQLLADPTGANRTMLGKGKDSAVAVNKAWEDLKGQIQNSGPVQGFDKKVSDLLSKIGAGSSDPELGGKVSGWAEGYRKFAKEHPIMQGAIYAALIAVLGLSGAGIGGAAALGLLKMADKLIQGERASSAAYSGAKTGAMAYAASNLLGGQAPETSQQFPVDSSIGQNLPTDVVTPPGVTSYTIEPGDTLSDIAKKMNVSVDELMKANDGATHYMSNHDPDLDKFTNIDAMGGQTGPQDYDVTQYTNPKITNPDVLSPGQQINIPDATGHDIYQAGEHGPTGLAQNTTDRIGTGEFTDSAISRAQQAKWDDIANAAKDTGAEAAKGAAGGAQQAIANRAAAATDSASDIAALAADQAGGGVTDIDTLKQGIAGNSDAAQAATNTDAASAMSSQSDATVNTATDFTSQGAPAGQAGSSYAGGGSDAAAAAGDTTSNAADAAGETAKAASEVTMKSAQEAARAATSRLADAAPGSMGKSAAEQMLQQDLHKAVTDAVTSGKLGNPTDLNFTSRISDFVNEYVAENGKLVKEVSGKQIGGTMQQILRSTGELAGKAAAGGTGSSEFVRGALVREYFDPHETVRMWALKESLGRHRGGLRLTEAGVQQLFRLVTSRSLNEGIMDTLKGAAGKVSDKLKQTGKNLTNKVTADKLNKAWAKTDNSPDSEVITKMMLDMGVPQPVIDAAFTKLGIKDPGAATGASAAKAADAQIVGKGGSKFNQETGKPFTSQADADAQDDEIAAARASQKSATAAPAAGGSQFVKDLVAGYMALSAAERAEIMKELDSAIAMNDNPNLVKGMNENKRHKKAVK